LYDSRWRRWNSSVRAAAREIGAPFAGAVVDEEEDDVGGLELARLRDVVLKGETWVLNKLVLSEGGASLEDESKLDLGRLASSAHV